MKLIVFAMILASVSNVCLAQSVRDLQTIGRAQRDHTAREDRVREARGRTASWFESPTVERRAGTAQAKRARNTDFAVEDWGYTDEIFTAIDVLGANEMLVMPLGPMPTPMLVRGVPTKNVVTGKEFILPHPFVVTGTHRYTSQLGQETAMILDTTKYAEKLATVKAEEEEMRYRSWTVKGVNVEAKYVGFKAGKVTLCLRDKSESVVSIAELSAEDKKVVSSERKQATAEEAVAAKAEAAAKRVSKRSNKPIATVKERPIPAKVTPSVPLPTPSLGVTGRYTSSSTGMTFEPIPAGTFLMGSSAADAAAYLKADPTSKAEFMTAEQPQHSVRITRPFYMGTHEVTQGEYQKLTQRNPSSFSATGDCKDKVTGLNNTRFPVENVSWYDAVEYCNLLSEADGLSPNYTITDIKRDDVKSIKSATVTVASGAASAPQGTGYRLPTEAEWEYASRAETTSEFWFGSQNNGKQANVMGTVPFGTTTRGPYIGRTTTVGQYASNKFGLYDTVGSVYEWCSDTIDENAYASRSETTDDPYVDASTDNRRVLRGGSWNDVTRNSRSAVRSGFRPDDRGNNIGFRVSRTQ